MRKEEQEVEKLTQAKSSSSLLFLMVDLDVTPSFHLRQSPKTSPIEPIQVINSSYQYLFVPGLLPLISTLFSSFHSNRPHLILPGSPSQRIQENEDKIFAISPCILSALSTINTVLPRFPLSTFVRWVKKKRKKSQKQTNQKENLN